MKSATPILLSLLLAAAVRSSSLPKQTVGSLDNLLDEDNQIDDDGSEDKITRVEWEIDDAVTPEVVTPKGTFRGFKQIVNNVSLFVFYGIPFAKPPTGELRFKRPQPKEKLEEVFDATTLPNSCWQTMPTEFKEFRGEAMWAPNTPLNEDCLYLNLWVPESAFEKREEELTSVLFWIYGGGFFSGTSTLDVYNGAVLAATEGLIVASVQYRVGPHGFLYFGTDDAPGNMGLLDQSLGLKWVHETIRYFGGDPASITAAGESCGSAAVGFQLLSPLSKNFIKRGIMTSGLPNVLYAFKSPEELKSRSFEFAKHAGCDQKEPKEITECLRNVDNDKLTLLQWKLYKGILDFPFSATVDNYFLSDYPDNILKSGRARRADLIMGTVRDEGTFFVIYHYLKYLSHTKATSVPYDKFLDMMNELFSTYSDKEREAIINEYTNWKNPEDGFTNLHRIGEAVGDSWFTCRHRQWADTWSSRGLNVFYYHFTQRFSSNPWAKWMGVMHGDDIGLLFGSPFSETPSPDREKRMSDKFMDMVGSFVRDGFPSPHWEHYTAERPVYLDVNSTTVSDASTKNLFGPNAERCIFWNKVLPMIRGEDGKKCSRRNPHQIGSSKGFFQNTEEHPPAT